MRIRGWCLSLKSAIQNVLNGSARCGLNKEKASPEDLLETPKARTGTSPPSEAELSKSVKLLLDHSAHRIDRSPRRRLDRKKNFNSSLD